MMDFLRIELSAEEVLHLVEPFAALFGSALVGLVVFSILFRLLLRWSRKTDTMLDDLLVIHFKGAFKLFLPLLFITLTLPRLSIETEIRETGSRVLELLLIVTFAKMLLSVLAVGKNFALHRYDLKAKDNLKARSVYTQITVIEKIATVIVVLLSFSAMLMTFEEVRRIGISILASAGLVGIIAGFAAQKSIGTLFAGIQIAFTQPFRIDDVVIVENEWGRIEEITLTYVVVKIWDERRLVLPITYFLEKPFQNWTRTSSQILGTVFLYADYTLPIPKLREKLTEILSGSPLWDRRVNSIQVTGCTEQTVEIRALMSSANASDSWDLRCDVREQLLGFIQKEFPESLPRFRASLDREVSENGNLL